MQKRACNFLNLLHVDYMFFMNKFFHEQINNNSLTKHTFQYFSKFLSYKLKVREYINGSQNPVETSQNIIQNYYPKKLMKNRGCTWWLEVMRWRMNQIKKAVHHRYPIKKQLHHEHKLIPQRTYKTSNALDWLQVIKWKKWQCVIDIQVGTKTSLDDLKSSYE